jgi:hypothetical protein
LEIRGLSVSSGYVFNFDDDLDWQLHGASINADVNADFDREKIFWSKFRFFFNAANGEIRNSNHKLAKVENWEIGLGLLVGMNIFRAGETSINLGAGFGLGFGMMSVGVSDAGKEKWKPDCPTFAEIVEDFDGLTCWLETLDGTYTSKKFMGEIGFDFGPLTITPSFEWSFNARKQGQVMTDMFKVGVSAGVQF